jgi:hypothetical protein
MWIKRWPLVVTLLLSLGSLSVPMAWARKLSERQGRVLKLLSSVMMTSLGLVMLPAPDLLSVHWIGALLLIVALLATLLIARLTGSGRTPA